MNRRGFLGSILLAAAAPAIVRADSLMRIVPTETLVFGGSGALRVIYGYDLVSDAFVHRIDAEGWNPNGQWEQHGVDYYSPRVMDSTDMQAPLEMLKRCLREGKIQLVSGRLEIPEGWTGKFL